jgi:hypothetical protein
VVDSTTLSRVADSNDERTENASQGDATNQILGMMQPMRAEMSAESNQLKLQLGERSANASGVGSRDVMTHARIPETNLFPEARSQKPSDWLCRFV